jgi:hypothetical protein
MYNSYLQDIQSWLLKNGQDKCLKPGAKPGRVVLTVDLSVGYGSQEAIWAYLVDKGYQPKVEFFLYSDGVHTHLLLKDEELSGDDEQLMDEWKALEADLWPNSAHLWRGSQSD